MQLPIHLHKYPFVRLLIPLIIGIYITHSFLYETGYGKVVVIVLSIISLFILVFSLMFKKYTFRWLTGVGIYMVLFTLGTAITELHLSSVHYQWPTKRAAYFVQLNAPPQEKANSLLCHVTVISRKDSSGVASIGKKILLYLTKDSDSRKLRQGDQLLFFGHIDPPRNKGNPEEFDYASYLLHQGISGTAFAYSGNWKQSAHDSSRSLKQIALEYRSHLLKNIKEMGFTGDDYAVLSALVLGYQNDLSEEIRESYSISGASHVLSLSGLHIGFLYILLEFLLGFANRSKKMMISRQILIVLILWSFAFITGLLPPVVRSVIMFSLIALSRLRNNRPVTLNTLAVAALFMLIYNPFYLYDISFQLSFLAVAGIVIIQPRLYQLIKTENRLLKYAWGVMSVSIAAQLSTTPILLYYFSRFSTHFLLTNVIVVPLVSGIMYLTVFTILLGFFPVIQSYFALLLKLGIRLLNGTVVFVEHLPFSSIDNIHINKCETVTLYLILLLGGCYLYTQKRKMLLGVLTGFLILILFQVEEKQRLQNIHSIVFYNNRNCPAVHLIESREASYLFSAEKDSIQQKLSYTAGRFWKKIKLKPPQTLPSSYSASGIWRRDDLLSFGGKTICMVKDHSWNNKTADTPLPLDYLYICKGYRGKLAWLTPLFEIRQVVIDSSVSDYYREVFKKECTSLGIEFISLSEKGAYQITL